MKSGDHMGILLTRTGFAEQIIEKYCSLETYDLENQMLIFYGGGAEREGRASSSYDTELTLKLFFMMKHLEQSGQKLSLNWNLLSQTLLKQVSMEAQKTPWISSIQRQQQKLAWSEIRRQQLQPEHMKEFLKLLTEKESQMLLSEVARLVQAPDIREQVGELTEKLPGLEAVSELTEKLFGLEAVSELTEKLPGLETVTRLIKQPAGAKMRETTAVYTALYGLLSGKIHLPGGSQEFFHIQDLYRRHEEQIFRETEKEAIKTELLQEEERIWWGTMETVLDILAIRPEQAKKAGRELAEILKLVDLSTVVSYEKLLEETKTSWETIWREEYHLEQTGEKLVHILKDQPEKLNVLRNVLRFGDRSFKEQIKVWIRDQVTQFRQESLERKQFFLENSPERKEWLTRLLTHEVSREIFRETVVNMESGQHEKEAVTEWLKNYETADRQVEYMKGQLIYQVRTHLGRDAAERLEQYFSRREQVTNQVVIGESAVLMEEQVKHILDSYFSVLRGEHMAAEMGPERELLLRNQIQERVHMPVERSVQENRRSLEQVMRLVRKSSAYDENRRRFSGNVRRYLEERAAERLRVFGGRIEPRQLFQGNPMILQMQTQPMEGYDPVPMQPVLAESYSQLQSQLLSAEGYSQLQMRTQPMESYSQPQVFRRQTHQEEELNETKTIVKKLNEKIEIQEKLVAELKKKAREPGLPPQVNISQLTGEVMKKMERELRLEKMRRGLL